MSKFTSFFLACIILLSNVNAQLKIRNVSNDEEPLIMFNDSKVVQNALLVSPNSIETVTVYKDPKDTEAYGAQAKQGVVVIRSKPGGKYLRLNELLDSYGIIGSNRELAVCVDGTILREKNLLVAEEGFIQDLRIAEGCSQSKLLGQFETGKVIAITTNRRNPSMTESMTTTEPDKAAPKADRLLRHVVLFKFKDGTTPENVKKVEDAFRGLPAKIKEIADFEFGTNNSPENLSQGFTHCFFVSFKNEKDREVYLPHPDHKAFVEVLKPHLDKVLVIDYWSGN